MNRLMTAITDATCGEACWSAREDICRCSCDGANHGITRTGGVPERTSKIDGLMYKLTAVGPEKDIEQQAREMLKGQIKSKVFVLAEVTYTYYWKAKDRRSPVRTRPATASQIERWHELAHFKANPVAAWDWHNAPSLLWERITQA